MKEITIPLDPTPNVPLPNALKRPLVFGDREQIEALKKWQKDIEEKEAREQDIKNGILKQYEATIQWSAVSSIIIWAKSEEEARDMVREETDFLDVEDAEIEFIDIDEIK